MVGDIKGEWEDGTRAGWPTSTILQYLSHGRILRCYTVFPRYEAHGCSLAFDPVRVLMLVNPEALERWSSFTLTGIGKPWSGPTGFLVFSKISSSSFACCNASSGKKRARQFTYRGLMMLSK
jgi:hypothetical protein